MTQEFRATSSVDIDRGQMVHISGVAGNGLIVEPATAATTEPEAPTGTESDTTA